MAGKGYTEIFSRNRVKVVPVKEKTINLAVVVKEKMIDLAVGSVLMFIAVDRARVRARVKVMRSSQEMLRYVSTTILYPWLVTVEIHEQRYRRPRRRRPPPQKEGQETTDVSGAIIACKPFGTTPSVALGLELLCKFRLTCFTRVTSSSSPVYCKLDQQDLREPQAL